MNKCLPEGRPALGDATYALPPLPPGPKHSKNIVPGDYSSVFLNSLTRTSYGSPKTSHGGPMDVQCSAKHLDQFLVVHLWRSYDRIHPRWAH